ncbi:hypothetical protein IO44_01445 [Gallibacterium anatis str. Avicor]|uniref:hypothetical protein n=1 Tax=Gallibacterium anatis TaxID=750 RepID=UPI00053135CA|nr:hypothetical protein [Gallibacterium anatis]KGQ57219.1 hypothetical protein IO44_01445 [Gallibacterium anatis str. Avicor]
MNILANPYITASILYILIFIWITDNYIENRKIDKDNYLIATLFFINILSEIYLYSKFEIESLIKIINPVSIITVILYLNFIILTSIILQNKKESNFTKLLLSTITISIPIFGYIFNEVILFLDFIPFRKAAIQIIEEITLLPVSNFLLFEKILISKTINVLWLSALLTIISEFIIFYFDHNKSKIKLSFSILLIFLLQFNSIQKWEQEFLTEKNITELLVKTEFYELPERCNNPTLKEVNLYQFKIIDTNKIIYAEPIWDKNIQIKERSNNNISSYKISTKTLDCYIDGNSR